MSDDEDMVFRMEVAKLSVEIAKVMRGHSGDIVMGALTTGLAIFIAHATPDTASSDKMINGVADKLRRLVERTRQRPRGKPQ